MEVNRVEDATSIQQGNDDDDVQQEADKVVVKESHIDTNDKERNFGRSGYEILLEKEKKVLNTVDGIDGTKNLEADQKVIVSDDQQSSGMKKKSSLAGGGDERIG